MNMIYHIPRSLRVWNFVHMNLLKVTLYILHVPLVALDEITNGAEIFSVKIPEREFCRVLTVCVRIVTATGVLVPHQFRCIRDGRIRYVPFKCVVVRGVNRHLLLENKNKHHNNKISE